MTSAAALAVRAGTSSNPDWALVLPLAGAALVGGYLGARAVPHIRASKLQVAFTVLLFGVAGYTACESLPTLLGAT